MTSFVTKNGSLILKDGKLLVGDQNCCCDVCSDCYDCFVNTAIDANGNTFVVGCDSSESTQYPFCGGSLSSGYSGAGDLCLYGNRFPQTGQGGCGSAGEPAGWQWAEGYPEAFGDCPYVFVFSSSSNDSPCDGSADPCDGYCIYTQTSFRVYKVNCAAKSLVDVTSEASANGEPSIQQFILPSKLDCGCSSNDFIAISECTPQLVCGSCSLGFGTWDPICADNECCDSGNCEASAGFQPDVSDCVCYPLPQMGQPIEGAYATYSECCAENFCPEPPP